MKLSFCVTRVAQYRTLGPLIEKAVVLGFEVEHILGPGEKGAKAHLSPTGDNVPAALARHGQVFMSDTVEEFHRKLESCEVVISTIGRGCVYIGNEHRKGGAKQWFVVEDARHSSTPTHRFDDADLIFWAAEETQKRAIRFLRSDEWRGVLGDEEVRKRVGAIQAHSKIPGWVRGDAVHHVDEEDVRLGWNIPLDVPVVLYNPDPYRFTPFFKRTYRGRNFTMHTDWYRDVWCEDHFIPRVWKAIRSDFRNIRTAFNPHVGEKAVLRAIRRFCDRNQALLVIANRRQKSRGKTAYTKTELQVQDRIINEDVNYPQTFLRACKMASLIISPYAGASCMDAAANTTPYLYVKLPDKCYAPEFLEERREHYPSDIFNFPGFAWTEDAETFIGEFSKKQLLDYAIQPEHASRYIKKYIGASDGKCSDRVIGEIMAFVNRNN